MNTSNRGQGPAPSPNESSALNLLVNAAGDRASDLQQQQQPRGGDAGGGSASLSLQRLNDLQRMRQLAGGGAGGQGGGAGGGGGEPSLEDQLFLQQHAAGLSGGFGGNTNSMLNQLRDAQNPLFSHMNQQQQLASLLGLGGGGSGSGGGGGGVGSNDLRLAQLRSMQQNQDLMALRSGGGLTGLLGSGGAGGSGGLGGAGGGYPMSDFQQLQRLEEIERRQRMLQQDTGSAMDRGLPGLQVGRDPLDGSSGRECIRINKDDDKDALEKTPGSVIVPCRARGMPMDHNFKVSLG